jgi:hypothetical protein
MAPDAVTAVQPTSAAPGEPVRIHGNRFTPTTSGNTVTIGETEATVDSATTNVIYARVPEGASGPSDVTVTSAGVTKALAGTFTAVTGGRPTFTARDSTLLPVSRSATVAWGDYDDDGDLDVAVAGEDTTGTLVTKIYRNDTDTGSGSSTSGVDAGSFTAIDAGIMGVRRGDLAWGDYDRDGDLDLFVADGDETTLYRNDGGGSFTPIDQFPEFTNSALDWGDFDGDGDLDLAVSGRVLEKKGRQTKIYENEGDDEFAPLGAGLKGLYRGDVAWGDYDGDGDLDLFTAGGDVTGGAAILYRNDGKGKFVQVDARINEVRDASAAWGDYDGDGDLDLALTGTGEAGARTEIYRNDDGRFQKIDAGLAALKDGTVDWGDFDGDGDLDLLVTGRPPARWPPRATIYENQGGDAFERAYGIRAGLTGVVGDAAWGDVEGDGDLDVALVGKAAEGKIGRIYTNDNPYADGKPPLRSADLWPRSGTGGTRTVLFGRGFDTTATNNTVTFGGTQASVQRATRRTLATEVPSGVEGPVTVTVDNGDSTVALGRRFLATRGATGVYLAEDNTGLDPLDGGSLDWGDYDGDGDQDLVMAGYDGDFNTARIYENVGDGAFLQIDAGIDLITKVRWIDYDNDGDLDLLAVGEHSSHAGTKLFRNDGDNTFTPTDLLNVNTVSSVGDYNNDGWVDVLTGETIYRNEGDGFSQFALLSNEVNGHWGDYDGDGDLDILGETKVARNDGNLKFTTVDLPTSIAAWGDHDNDGDLDFVSGKRGRFDDRPGFDYSYFRYENQGEGTFERTELDLPNKSLNIQDWRDADADGDLDLLVRNDGYTLYRNAGNGTYRRADAGFQRKGIHAWGDYNGDGILDLLITGDDPETFELGITLHRGVPAGESVPGAPSDLVAEAPEDSVALSWTASSAADVERYRIYRDTTTIAAADGGYLDTVSADETTYVDTTAAPDVVYRYRVTAVDTLGHESALSSEAEAMLEGVTIAGVEVAAGWDLASVPVSAPDSGFAEVLPQCERGFSFRAGEGYQSIGGSEPVSPGAGVFADCEGGTSTFTGRVPDTATVDVEAGWNLIGPHVDAVDASAIESDPAGIVSSKYYGLDQGYTAAEALVPGEGYWVRADESGTLTLAAGIGKTVESEAALAENEASEPSGTKLAVTDARGRTATLRLARSLSEKQRRRSALPPVAPGETFDVRFAAGRSAAAFDADKAEDGESLSYRRVEVQGAAPPLTLRLQETGEGQSVLLRRGSQSAQLRSEGAEAQVRDGEDPLEVALRAAPEDFALKKNYPNPATRRATIEYAVPERAEVTIQVYDVLGRRVATLVDGATPAGRHSLQLDASRLSSGTYFYRMQAAGYTETRRLVIVK